MMVAALVGVGDWLTTGQFGLVLALAGTLLAAGCLSFATNLSRRRQSAALVRLDWYLPFLRKRKKNALPVEPPLWIRAARRVLPQRLFADPMTGRPGLLRRLLRFAGPSWLSSPLRRVIQGACFGMFLWLFFYVCWPYTARPGLSSSGWKPVEFNAETGIAVLETNGSPIGSIAAGSWLHLMDDSVVEPEQRFG